MMNSIINNYEQRGSHNIVELGYIAGSLSFNRLVDNFYLQHLFYIASLIT